MPQLTQSFDEQVKAQEMFVARHLRWARRVAIAELSLIVLLVLALVVLVAHA